MIRPCNPSDFGTIYEIINDAAKAYRGAIPEQSLRGPYISRSELSREIRDGILFWGDEQCGDLTGVMGLQEKEDVTLIRHAYVRTRLQKRGVGANLLRHLEGMAQNPILIGTWANATWAISFYEKHGYKLVSEKKKDILLRTYWSINDLQVQSSVVLAQNTWTEVNAQNVASVLY